MKIGILIHTFPPHQIGGAEIAAEDIAKALSEKGHEVHVLTVSPSNRSYDEERNGFVIHYVRFSRRFTYTLGETILALRFLWMAKEYGLEVIHSFMITNGRFGLVIKKLLGIPYVVSARGLDINMKMNFILRTRGRIVLANADATTALNTDMQSKLQELFTGDVTIIPNGIDRGFMEKHQGSGNRMEYAGYKRQQHAGKKVILFVGRLAEVKGLEFLLSAFKTILSSREDVVLLLVGDGPEGDALISLSKELDIDKNTEFMGEIPHDDLGMFLSIADIFVLPSLSEGDPHVIKEAMAFGLPIIASRVGGIPEILAEGRNGLLIEPGNPDDLAGKLEMLLSDEEMRTRIGGNNLNECEKYYLDNILGDIEDLYASIVR